MAKLAGTGATDDITSASAVVDAIAAQLARHFSLDFVELAALVAAVAQGDRPILVEEASCGIFRVLEHVHAFLNFRSAFVLEFLHCFGKLPCVQPVAPLTQIHFKSIVCVRADVWLIEACIPFRS